MLKSQSYLYVTIVRGSWFGVTKFYKCMVGQKLTIFTDLKPLIYLLEENFHQHNICYCYQVGIIVKWLQLFLSLQAGTELGNADGLSRLPFPVHGKDAPPPAELVHLVEYADQA